MNVSNRPARRRSNWLRAVTFAISSFKLHDFLEYRSSSLRTEPIRVLVHERGHRCGYGIQRAPVQALLVFVWAVQYASPSISSAFLLSTVDGNCPTLLAIYRYSETHGGINESGQARTWFDTKHQRTTARTQLISCTYADGSHLRKPSDFTHYVDLQLLRRICIK